MKKRVAFIFMVFLSTSTFLFTSLFSINTAEEMSGVSRVVNYAGIVRGATQRLVKLEICNKQNDELIVYLDGILNDLRFDDLQEYNLKTLEDKKYNDKLNVLNEKWLELKQEIALMRGDISGSNNILKISEEHFFIANDAVHLAENYGECLSDKMNNIKKILTITIISLFLASIVILFSIMKLRKENKKIEQLSNIDFSTKLPNKSRCERLFSDYGILDPKIKYGMIMFDLNNLKTINDSFGHQFGDDLIASFANIIKSTVYKDTFTGRFGGDEFIVIFHHADRDLINAYIDSIKAQVEEFNLSQTNVDFKISFAAGYSWTHEVDNMTMKMLCDKADEDMYFNKRTAKNKCASKDSECYCFA